MSRKIEVYVDWLQYPRFSWITDNLRYGGLPQVYLSEDPEEELFAYTDTYLREEIQAEALVRKIPQFARFLKSSALGCGEMLNYTEIANDAGIPISTVREYYTILEDTLIGFNLMPWTKSQKRKAIQTGKFYFFDPGVTHTLPGTKSLDRNSSLYGSAFEQFIIMEIRAYLSYKRIRDDLCYWRSTHGHEVDAVIGDYIGIEIKATKKVTSKHLKGLKAIAEENILENLWIVSQDETHRDIGAFKARHYSTFLNQLWNGQII